MLDDRYPAAQPRREPSEDNAALWHPQENVGRDGELMPEAWAAYWHNEKGGMHDRARIPEGYEMFRGKPRLDGQLSSYRDIMARRRDGSRLDTLPVTELMMEDLLIFKRASEFLHGGPDHRRIADMVVESSFNKDYRLMDYYTRDNQIDHAGRSSDPEYHFLLEAEYTNQFRGELRHDPIGRLRASQDYAFRYDLYEGGDKMRPLVELAPTDTLLVVDATQYRSQRYYRDESGNDVSGAQQYRVNHVQHYLQTALADHAENPGIDGISEPLRFWLPHPEDVRRTPYPPNDQGMGYIDIGVVSAN